MENRYVVPSKIDVAPYGTIYNVIGDNNTPSLYIQLGTEPIINWQPMSFLMGHIFSPCYTDPAFIELCLALYHESPKDALQFNQIAKHLLSK